MFPTEILLPLVIALALAIPLSLMLGRWRRRAESGVWPMAAIVFLILFFALWGSLIFATEDAPGSLTVLWLPFAAFGVLVVILLMMLFGRDRRRRQKESKREREEVRETISVARSMLYLLLMAVGIALIAMLL